MREDRIGKVPHPSGPSCREKSNHREVGESVISYNGPQLHWLLWRHHSNVFWRGPAGIIGRDEEGRWQIHDFWGDLIIFKLFTDWKSSVPYPLVPSRAVSKHGGVKITAASSRPRRHTTSNLSFSVILFSYCAFRSDEAQQEVNIGRSRPKHFLFFSSVPFISFILITFLSGLSVVLCLPRLIQLFFIFVWLSLDATNTVSLANWW